MTTVTVAEARDSLPELLRRVATAVQGCVRRADLVARIGGDEFAVFLTGATPAEAQHVADKIRAAVSAVWPIGIPGGVSVGISAAGQGAGDALGRADRAMYADKRRPPPEPKDDQDESGPRRRRVTLPGMPPTRVQK